MNRLIAILITFLFRSASSASNMNDVDLVFSDDIDVLFAKTYLNESDSGIINPEGGHTPKARDLRFTMPDTKKMLKKDPNMGTMKWRARKAKKICKSWIKGQGENEDPFGSKPANNPFLGLFVHTTEFDEPNATS